MFIRYRSVKKKQCRWTVGRPSSKENLKTSHVISASSIAEDDGLVLVNGVTYLGDVEDLKRE